MITKQDQNNAMNKHFQEVYDRAVASGIRGHYESMFKALHDTVDTFKLKNDVIDFKGNHLKFALHYLSKGIILVLATMKIIDLLGSYLLN